MSLMSRWTLFLQNLGVLPVLNKRRLTFREFDVIRNPRLNRSSREIIVHGRGKLL